MSGVVIIKCCCSSVVSFVLSELYWAQAGPTGWVSLYFLPVRVWRECLPEARDGCGVMVWWWLAGWWWWPAHWLTGWLLTTLRQIAHCQQSAQHPSSSYCSMVMLAEIWDLRSISDSCETEHLLEWTLISVTSLQSDCTVRERAGPRPGTPLSLSLISVSWACQHQPPPSTPSTTTTTSCLSWSLWTSAAGPPPTPRQTWSPSCRESGRAGRSSPSRLLRRGRWGRWGRWGGRRQRERGWRWWGTGARLRRFTSVTTVDVIR